jgi:hypothetical protein
MDIEPETDEARLTAYALGELDESERPAVYTRLAEDAEGRRLVSDVRELADQLTRALKEEPAPSLTPAQRQAILDRLSESERPRVLPFPGARAILPLLAAAVLLAGVGLSIFFRDWALPRAEVAQMGQPPAAPAVAAEDADWDREQPKASLDQLAPAIQTAQNSQEPPTTRSMSRAPTSEAAPLNATVELAAEPPAEQEGQAAGASPKYSARASSLSLDAGSPGEQSFALDEAARGAMQEQRSFGRDGRLARNQEAVEETLFVFGDGGDKDAATDRGYPKLAKAPAAAPMTTPKREAAARSRGTSAGEDAVARELETAASAQKSESEMGADSLAQADSASPAPAQAPADSPASLGDQVLDRQAGTKSAQQAGVAGAPAALAYQVVLAERADTTRIPLSAKTWSDLYDRFDLAEADRNQVNFFESKGREPAALADKDPKGMKQEGDQKLAEGMAPLTLSVDMADCPWNERTRLGRVVLTARPPAAGEDDRAVVAYDVSLDVTLPTDQTQWFRWVLPAAPVAGQGDASALAGNAAGGRPATAGAPLAAGRQVVGLVEIAPKPQARPEIRAKARYRLAPGGAPAPELAATAADEGRRFDRADPSFRFATAVGAFGLASQPGLSGGMGGIGGEIAGRVATVSAPHPTLQQALGWAKASQDGEPSRLSIVQSMERKLGVDRGPSTEGAGLAAPAPAPSPPAGPQP